MIRRILVIAITLLGALAAYIAYSEVRSRASLGREVLSISYVNDLARRSNFASTRFVLRDCLDPQGDPIRFYDCDTSEVLLDVSFDALESCIRGLPEADYARGSFVIVSEEGALEPNFVELFVDGELVHSCGSKPWYWPT